MSRKQDLRPAPSLTPEEVIVIRAQLERILASHQFRGSRRCQGLLRHITEQTLTGETAGLKERSLGIEVFDRATDYDTGQDPIVRATAAEIRKRLAQYYQEPDHTGEPRIGLLAGSYVAEFQPNGNGTPVLTEPRGWRRPAAILGAALLFAALFIFALPRWKETDLDRLWKPVLKSPGTVLVSIGQPITYNLKSIQAQDAIQGIGTPVHPESESDSIPKKDLVILPDRYAALGDVVCLAHLTSFLERHRRAYRIRGERSTTFADLRETPTVLIGAFDNQWTMHAAGQLRYTFSKVDARATDSVHDRQHPENTSWKLTGAWPYWDVSGDYAIVTRILKATTDRPLVIAAGITQYGTTGAGEFLTRPEYFAEAVPKLPRDWQSKNVQFVLYIPVVNRVPGHPQLLATHVW